jgi:predicted ester cyclase
MRSQWTYTVSMVYIAEGNSAKRRRGKVRASDRERALEAFRESIRNDFPGKAVWFPEMWNGEPGKTIE